MGESAGEQDLQSWELVNTELAARLVRQDQSLSRIETKATVVMGFAATAAQFLATRHPFQTHVSGIFGGIAFGLYALAFGAGLLSTRVATWEDIDGVRLRDYAPVPKIETLQRLVAERREQFTNNGALVKRKALWWLWSVSFLMAGLVTSAVCIVQTR